MISFVAFAFAMGGLLTLLTTVLYGLFDSDAVLETALGTTSIGIVLVVVSFFMFGMAK